MFKKLFENKKNDTKRVRQAQEMKDTEICNIKISKKLDEVKYLVERRFGNTVDFILRDLYIGEKRIIICYLDGLVNQQVINENIIKPLLELKSDIKKLTQKGQMSKDTIKEALNVGNLKEATSFEETLNSILSGKTIIYRDGEKQALVLATEGWESRGIDEPETESTVRGPREGFNENLKTNIALLRRKIKSTDLQFEKIQIGRFTKTNICICYLQGIVDEQILDTVRRRLKRIDTDSILESGYIEEFIEDQPFSLFPTIGNSEKPDKVASKILEGRVAILCDGTPFVLTVPLLFIESLHASEDFYSRPYYTSFIRLIRLFALFITLTIPGFYVALTTFHVKVIPFELLLSIAAANEGIPFNPFVETLIMIIVFELLREAGIRMPRPVGQAVSIVGALVIGEAVVKAGFVSSPIVIITALTAITSFIVPSTTGFVGLLRIYILIASSVLGFMGMFVALMGIILHLCSLRSFGVPYLYPISPLNIRDQKDAIVRLPIWKMLTRPRILSWQNIDRNRYRMKIDYRKKED